MPTLTYEGCTMFRERITASLLSGNAIRIINIRSEYHHTNNENISIGLQDFEASYLRLIDNITDGTVIEINETGTTLKFKPGIIVGGEVSHDCCLKRSIGWYIEGILPLIIFGKEAFNGRFNGITNDTQDFSVDFLRGTTLPMLYHFGIESIAIKTLRRGSPPNGGGEVELTCQLIRELKPVELIEPGLVKRVRGTAYCSKISPTMLTRVIDASRAILNNLLPDVYIHTDHYKGVLGGKSPGYSLYLSAITTTGMQYAVERTANAHLQGTGEVPEVCSFSVCICFVHVYHHQLYLQDIGQECAFHLLDEISRGGCIDSSHQVLTLILMAMGPEDITKVRFGSELTENAISMLQILKDHFGIVFKIKNEDIDTFPTIVVSCLGIGFKNMARKIK